MRTIGFIAVCVVAMAGLAPDAAMADVYIQADWPRRLVDRPLTLGPGMIELRGDTFIVDLSSGSVGDPLLLAPDIYYGVSKKLTVGIDHEQGICVSGAACDTYNDARLDALYSLVYTDRIHLAARGGARVADFDPATAGVEIGLAARLGFANLAVVLEPRLYVGLLERETYAEQVDVPLQVQYQLNESNALFLRSGVRGPLDGFGDAVQVPVGLGALFVVTRRFDVGLEILFPNLAGKGATADARALIVRVALRI